LAEQCLKYIAVQNHDKKFDGIWVNDAWISDEYVLDEEAKP
jgi:hypothetical protein